MEEELFNCYDMDLIFKLMTENSIKLSEIKEYQMEEKKLQKAKKQICKYPKEVQDIFNNAIASFEMTSNYEICLGYYLGLKKGLEIQKLK